MRRHQSPLIVVALALSLLAGCSSDKGADNSSGDKGSAGSNSGADSTSPQGIAQDPAKNGASGIGIDQPDLSKVIFSKQFAVPGKPQRKVTVGILSLERKDRLAVLKVVITPEFTDLAPTETVSHFKALGDSSWRPTLLDLRNLKEYRVLSGSGGPLSFEEGEAVSGQPIYAWAVFAAPPAGVTRLDLTMVDWMPRITNVPIQ